MAAADRAAVGGVELEGGIVLLQEGGEARPDRAGAQQRHLGDAALAEPFIPFGEEAKLVVGAVDEAVVVHRDDRCGDGQSVQITLANGRYYGLELRGKSGGHAFGRRGLPARLFAPRAGLCALHRRRTSQTGLIPR